jgi:hypothetical protein
MIDATSHAFRPSEKWPSMIRAIPKNGMAIPPMRMTFSIAALISAERSALRGSFWANDAISGKTYTDPNTAMAVNMCSSRKNRNHVMPVAFLRR